MIFTRGFLSEFLNINDIKTEQIYKALNTLGLEVDSLEHYCAPKGVKVGKVLTCEKHANSDKLSVCSVDVGEKEPLQIVCGAKNVCANIFVPVATVGTKLGELEIKESELRGVKSSGMICSSTEIGLVKINDGIMKLDSSIGNFKIGQELSAIPFFNDDIFEIDITPNRGDCLNIYGIARDICAYFDIKIKNPEPANENETSIGIGRILQLSHHGHLDSSYMFKAAEVGHGELSLKILLRLAQNGLLDESTAKNIANYSMLVSGVILHPYYEEDTLKGDDGKRKLEIKKEEGLDTVYGNKKLSTTGIFAEESEKKGALVFFEASYIPPQIVSQAVFEKKCKKKQEIFFRSSRGSNPNLKFGIDVLSKILAESGFCKPYSGTHEILQKPHNHSINISVDSLSAAIGISIQKQQIVTILKRLNFGVEVSSSGDSLVVGIPDFRHDVVSEQDITEEIVRVIGIDNIQSSPTIMREERKLTKGYEEFKKRSHFRKTSASNGFNETIHFVFDHKEKLKELGFIVLDSDLDVANPITSELNTLRPTLLLHLIESAQRNRNNGKKSLSLFEIGSVYGQKREESTKIAFLHSGAKERDSLQNAGKPTNMTFFDFANKIANVIGNFSIKETLDLPNKLVHPYQFGKVMVEGEECGYIAKLHPEIAQSYGLDDTFICEVEFGALPFTPKIAQEYSKFPKSERDLSIVIDKSMPFAKIKEVIAKTAPSAITKFYPVDIYEIPDTQGKISLTLRFELESMEKTFNEEEISTIMTTILGGLKEELKVELR